MPPQPVPPQPRLSLDTTGAPGNSVSVSTPAGAAGILANRVLVHARPRGITGLIPAVDPRRSGIILCGDEPERGLKRCRDADFKGVLAIDPRGYEDGPATPESPFTLSPDDQLFEPSLEQVLDDQREAGADVALTPTRFIEAGDADSLKAAARTAAELDRDDTIFSVPIHIAWLNSTYINQLIAVLVRVPLSKGIFLGEQLDPLDNVKEAVANMRRLCAEAGSVAVLRTDFEGFDACAHGAFSASIGTGGTLRHIIPPSENPRSVVLKDQSPSVLVPDLIHFFKGTTIAKRYANAAAPACMCAVCRGRRIDTFLGREDSTAAHLHNVRVWMEWLPDLLSNEVIGDRAQWWQGRCEAAVTNHDIYNAQLDLRNAFKPPRALTIWAERTLRQRSLRQPAR
jgi:hypothetical protein